MVRSNYYHNTYLLELERLVCIRIRRATVGRIERFSLDLYMWHHQASHDKTRL